MLVQQQRIATNQSDSRHNAANRNGCLESERDDCLFVSLAIETRLQP